MSEGRKRRSIVRNRRATHEFSIEETIEAGIVLVGSEVKSIRDGRVGLADCHAVFEGNELWLRNLHVAEYPQANQFNHEPLRPRKLLVHRRQLESLRGKVEREGYALIPLEIYLTGGRVKVALGLGRGKKAHDKREAIKERDARREMARALKG
ncbi:MAG: SsrA-binding protein SmpB [Deltaproteobacteria bacterium]|nr:MAG: SsrA-binding protein SmpB [Deltaproteobacteria bacterium]